MDYFCVKNICVYVLCTYITISLPLFRYTTEMYILFENTVNRIFLIKADVLHKMAFGNSLKESILLFFIK